MKFGPDRRDGQRELSGKHGPKLYPRHHDKIHLVVDRCRGTGNQLYA